MKEENELEKKLSDEWRKGYDLGVEAALRENDIAIKIGRAILDALDDRYKFKNNDY